MKVFSNLKQLISCLYADFRSIPKSFQFVVFLSFFFGSLVRIFNLTHYGFYFDIVETQYTWGKSGFEMGVFGFWKDYSGFFDYSFLSLVFETFIYAISKIFGGSASAFAGVLKSFNWIVEIVLAFYVGRLVYKYSPEIDLQTKKNKGFLLAALVYCIPSLWFVSGVWGQNDTLIALLAAFSIEMMYKKINFEWVQKLPKSGALGSWVEILNNNFFWSGVVLAISFWIKQQAILALPVIFLFHLKGKKWMDLFNLILWVIPFILLFNLGIKYYNSNQWESILAVFILIISLLTISMILFVNKKDNWLNARRQGFGFLLFSLLIIIPTTITNYFRTGMTMFAVIGRANMVENGATSFWRLLNITGDANQHLFIINNTGYITIGFLAILIYLIIMVSRFYSFQQITLTNLTKFRFQQMVQRPLELMDAWIFMTISSGAYFLFFTKMHSRYLHFLIIFSLLSLAIIKIGANFYRWLCLTILIHFAYFLNQMGVYNVQDKSASTWVGDFLGIFNQQYWDYWKLSSLIILLCFLGFYSVSRDIFNQKTQTALDKN